MMVHNCNYYCDPKERLHTDVIAADTAATGVISNEDIGKLYNDVVVHNNTGIECLIAVREPRELDIEDFTYRIREYDKRLAKQFESKLSLGRIIFKLITVRFTTEAQLVLDMAMDKTS